MKRVLVLTEGQTEESFVKKVLAPQLAVFEKWPEATCVCTRRERGRRAFRGGGNSYEKIKSDLRSLLGSNPAAVTTMIDYYALSPDFPGRDSLPSGGTCFDRVAHLEAAFAADIADSRFIPNLVLHEFEGILFTSPKAIAEVMLDTGGVRKLEAIATQVRSPEEINDGPSTHPSQRLKDIYAAAYQKPLHGIQIAEQIGLPAIRAKCKHLDAWIRRLEAL